MSYESDQRLIGDMRHWLNNLQSDVRSISYHLNRYAKRILDLEKRIEHIEKLLNHKGGGE